MATGTWYGRANLVTLTGCAAMARHGGKRSRTRYCALAVATAIALLQGCSSPARLVAVPKEHEDAAVVAGMTGIRYWKQADIPQLQNDAFESYMREVELAAFSLDGGFERLQAFVALPRG